MQIRQLKTFEKDTEPEPVPFYYNPDPCQHDNTDLTSNHLYLCRGKTSNVVDNPNIVETVLNSR